MEPTDALRSIETALRLVIRQVLGEEGWLRAQGAPDEERLHQRLVEERKRRDSVVVSVDLLDYTETYHLTALIEQNWEKFKPVFQDKGRTQAFFGVIADVRNSVAHSRELVPFERDLISGIAGQIRNQVSLFRSRNNKSSRYYPLIEEVKDSFGNRGRKLYDGVIHRGARLEIGSVITFTGSAFNAKSKTVRWLLDVSEQKFDPREAVEVAQGDAVTFDYVMTEDDVDENLYVNVFITTDSRYHRYRNNTLRSFDDCWQFWYAVNPPEDD